MSKLNILFFAGNRSYLINLRGGEKSMSWFARKFTNEFNVYVFTLDNNISHTKLENNNNVTFITNPFTKTMTNPYFKIDEKKIKLLNDVIDKYKIDVLISHAYYGEVAARSCKIKNIKYIHFVRWWAEFREKRPIGRLFENKN